MNFDAVQSQCSTSYDNLGSDPILDPYRFLLSLHDSKLLSFCLFFGLPSLLLLLHQLKHLKTNAQNANHDHYFSLR